MNAAMKLISIILTSLELASSQHQLSVCVTEVVSFHCNTDGFNKRAHEFLALQIMKRGMYSGEEHVLATVDNTGDAASVSSYLASLANCTASGKLDQKGSGSWLMLTLDEFQVDKSDAYFCKIVYMDHPADLTLLTWNSDELYVNRTTRSEEMKNVPGFFLKFAKGAQVRCEQVDASAVTVFIADAATERSPFACWDKYSNRLSCSPPPLEISHESKLSGLTQEDHLPEVTCAHNQLSVWTCKVSANHRSHSLQESLKLEACHVSNDNTKKHGYDKDVTSYYAIVPVFILFLVVIMVLVYRRKTHCQKKAKKHCPREQNETKPGTGYQNAGKECKRSKMTEDMDTSDPVPGASEDDMETNDEDSWEENSPALCYSKSPEEFNVVDLGLKLRVEIV